MFRRIIVVIVVTGVLAGLASLIPRQLSKGSHDRLPVAEPAVEGSIVRLARAVDGSKADTDDIDYWASRYRDGQTLQAIGDQFAKEPNFVHNYGRGSDTEFVDALYDDLLDRHPTAAERRNWAQRLGAGNSRGAVLVGVTESPEYVRRTHTPAPRAPRRPLAPAGVEHSVVRIYLGFTGRWPNRRQLDADVHRYLDGVPLARIADDFLARSEAAARFRDANDAAFVHALYTDVLGRSVDKAKARQWRAKLAAGASRGSVAVAFTESKEMLARTHTAVPLPAPIPHKLLTVGDSVQLGAVKNIQAIRGWEIHTDARGCRQPTYRGDGCGAKNIPTAVDALQAARRAGYMGGVVVIHMGNNGPMSAEQFDAMMREVADQRLVFAVTLHEPRRFEAPNNAVIHQATARWHNLRILDWHTYAGAHPEFFGDGEGIHLSHVGAQAMADFIAAALPKY